MAWSLGRRSFATLRALFAMNTGHLDNAALFTPAINRSMKVLDRAFFNKTVTLAALTVLENKNISSTRKALLGSKELLDFNTVSNIVNDASGKKSLLLQPGIEHGGTYSRSMNSLDCLY